MPFIKAYYLFFCAFIYAIAGFCQILTFLNRLLSEGTIKERPRHRRSFLSPLGIEERMLQLKHLF